MLPSGDFLSYGTDVPEARSDYRQKVLDMYHTALTSLQLGDVKKKSLIHVGDQLLDIIPITVHRMKKGETSVFRRANLEALTNAVLDNASAALPPNNPGDSHVFFRLLVHGDQQRAQDPCMHEKKLSILERWKSSLYLGKKASKSKTKASNPMTSSCYYAAATHVTHSSHYARTYIVGRRSRTIIRSILAGTWKQWRE